ncbi:hypothetical protein GJ744_002203 [Endocarpon pusillum]|uniref:Uncharacterized protein n=1 Tax=Endocarpon pusillum TaxID=364733 RepID=A0A8H7AC86_9EURO|nr:hypothetical protein GJ744_002203 [Endocarpon pusillum]
MDPRPHPLGSHRRPPRRELEFRFHLMDDHGLSRTCLTGKSDAVDGVSTQKRKTTGATSELSWMSGVQFSPSHPPKKMKRTQQSSPTIASSLLSRSEAEMKNAPPVIDLTASESSTEILAGPPSAHSGGEYTWLPDELEYGSKPPIRFGS